MGNHKLLVDYIEVASHLVENALLSGIQHSVIFGHTLRDIATYR